MHIFLSVAIQTVPNPAAKLLLFFELTKFFGKDLQNRRGKLTSNSQIYQV